MGRSTDWKRKFSNARFSPDRTPDTTGEEPTTHRAPLSESGHGSRRPEPQEDAAPAAGTVHVLLVGINAYHPSVASQPLKGCLHDVAAARTWLENRVDAPSRCTSCLTGKPPPPRSGTR